MESTLENVKPKPFLTFVVQMGKFKTWLLKEGNHVEISTTDFVALVNELDSLPVAIRGNGVFPVTYTGYATVNP